MRVKLKKILAIAFCVANGVQVMAQDSVSGVVASEPTMSVEWLNEGDQQIEYKEIASSHRKHSFQGPRFYLQTEAAFLAREYDAATSQFALLSSPDPVGPFQNFLQGADPRLVGLSWVNIPTPVVSATLNPADVEIDGLASTPRLTFGAVGDHGWGIQGRYWQMQNDVGSFGSLVNIPRVNPAWQLGQITTSSVFEQFEAKTMDLELTRDIAIGSFVGSATLGARYAEIDNVRQTAVDGAMRTGMPGILVSGDSLANSFHTADYDFQSMQGMSFQGTGPTFSLSTLCPITRSLSLFSSGRGSMLFGESTSTARVDGQMSSLFDDDYVSVAAEAAANDPLFIAELQCGLEWSVPTRFLNGRFFARGAFEYQFWRHAAMQANAAIDPTALGDYGDNHAILFPLNNAGQPRGQIDSGVGTTRGQAAVSSLASDFDLIGFSFGTGFLW